MNLDLQALVDSSPLLAFGALILLSLIVYGIARAIVGRGLTFLASRTETQYDDIIVEYLHPYRVAWVAPLLLIYSLAYLWPDHQLTIGRTALFLILWVVTMTLSALLNALNQVYESSPSFSGVSIQSYLDILKMLLFLAAIILSISLLTGESPLALLTGLGAVTAVLLLVFRDTILSIVASIQIAAHDLVKEGDWIEVPSYGADGEVLNMSLHTIKVQNWDKTITVIPTYKMIEVAYRNWRGMEESGGRRIKRSLSIDMGSVQFCDADMLERLSKIDLIHDYLEARLAEIDGYRLDHQDRIDSELDGPQVTNIELYRAYIKAYLWSREDIHHDDMTLLIRALSPSPSGLPIEVYAFTRTTVWDDYESIQAEIFDHLLAAAPSFDLRIFQEPTGMDLAAGVGRADRG